MNPRLERLHAYPFERLARLKSGVTPPADKPHIAMSIGEPQHAAPPFVIETLRASLDQLGSYPATAGLPAFRAACANWLQRRFRLPPLSVNPDTMVLPVNGTREALFAFVQAVVDDRRDAAVLMPNPFYQIYEGAALLAGAEPCFVDTTAATGYAPDLDGVPPEVWRRCQILFLCSPGNPTGTVLSLDFLKRALELAERYDFIVASDECYTELYLDELAPPPGLLQASSASGGRHFARCIVFHSLSKRSSVPGLRSGFVAGDPQIVARFLLYRTYHGSAMAIPTQLASITAWNEDSHVVVNRNLYREKFDRVLPILAPVMDVQRPQGAFYLWLDVREAMAHRAGSEPALGADELFTRELFATQNITVLPGTYLARDGGNGNPAAGRVRISLVPPVAQCVEAAERIRQFVQHR